MKTKRIVILLVAIWGLYMPVMAENKSTNKDNVISSLRGRVTAPKVGDFSFFFDQEIRSTDNFGSFKDSRTSLFGVYGPLSWLKISAGYAFMVKEGSDSPSIKNRFILSFEQTLKLSGFSFTLRERLESTSANGYLFASSDEAGRVNLFRTRLKINYSKGQRAVPYIYTELYNQTNTDMLLTRVRSQAGVEYSLTDKTKLTAFYQYAFYTNVSSSTAPHTFGVLYAYKFSSKKK